MMKKTVCAACAILLSFYAFSSDTLVVKLMKPSYRQGDTISFDCSVPNFAKDSIVGTLDVIIEDVDRHTRWKYRYPILNGMASADLLVSDLITDGRYAVNFIVRKGFFHIEGKVKDYKTKWSPLSYLVMAKKKESYLNEVTPQADGSLRLKNMYIEDTAYIVFSPPQKYRTDNLWIDIKTPMDSSFTPYTMQTKLITVSSSGTVNQPTPSNYRFDLNAPVHAPGDLPGVTVTTVKKKLVERFNDTYSTGLFRGNEYMTFDGLESNQIARSYNIYDFLQWKIPGFTAKQNDDGGYNLRWRNTGVSVFLDEYPLQHFNDYYINPSDVAMIKVFSAPSALGSRNGVIAIYTKRGDYDVDPNSKSKFTVVGYTAAASVWK
ncbi:hypothetical protein ACI6Q2_14110 [Chitinophagaceae bacterium LWZ2-11]